MTLPGGADGLHVNCTRESPGSAFRQNLGPAALADSTEHGSFGARTRADAFEVMPPATIEGPPTMVAARHVTASARSHGRRHRRRV